MSPDSATTAPTERSMPPVRTANVIPIDTTQRIDTLASRFSMFALETNLPPSAAEKYTAIPTTSKSTAA